jgi:ribosomal protein S30
MPVYGALSKAQKKGGQTLEEQGKVSINLILIIRNKMNYVMTIRKRLQFRQ